MNPYVIIGFLLALAGAGAGGFKLGADHEVASQARQDKYVAQAIQVATDTSAKAIAEQKKVFTTIQGKVIHETSTNTIYADCKLPADGLRLVNEALNGGAIPVGSGKLPK